VEFEQALARLEERFGVQTEVPTSDEVLIVVTGGVVQSARDPIPALALTPGLAVSLWLDVANRKLGDLDRPVKAWKIDGKPILDTMHMTLMDNMGTQRVVERRYSAQATIRIRYKTQAEIDDEVRKLSLWLEQPPAPWVPSDDCPSPPITVAAYEGPFTEVTEIEVVTRDPEEAKT
jgi:hypothetical protein